jgi:parallel beta-helix repeat protein
MSIQKTFGLLILFLLNAIFVSAVTGIDSCGQVDTGNYILNNSLNHSGANDCLVIIGNNVSIDGNGFSIIGDGSDSVNGVYGNNLENIDIFDLKISKFSYGINVNNVSNSRVSDIEVYENTYAGLYLLNSNNFNFTTSEVYSNYNYGITMFQSGDILIEDNNLYNNSNVGIYLYGSNNNSILENSIYENSFGGISVTSSSNLEFTRNEIYNNDGFAFVLGSIFSFVETSNLVIENNKINDNLGALNFISSSDNLIFENEISDNSSFGVSVDSNSNNNTFYGNEFKLKFSQFDGLGNFNNSNKGNYWFNFDGSGYSLTCDNYNGDDFCDDELVLNVGNNNTDFLPLTNLKSTEISKCIELDMPNTEYILISDIYLSGSCLSVVADNITLVGDGFTVFGNSSINDSVGILVSANNFSLSDIKVKDFSTSLVGDNLSGNGTYVDNYIESFDFNNSDLNLFFDNIFNGSDFVVSSINNFNNTDNGNYWFNSLSTGFSQICLDSDYNGFCDESLNLNYGNTSVDYLAFSSVIFVNSCIELNIPNSIYVLSSDIYLSGSCFSVTAENVTLVGDGFTIFGNSSINDSVGILVSANNFNLSDIKIKDFSSGLVGDNLSGNGTYVDNYIESFNFNNSELNLFFDNIFNGSNFVVSGINYFNNSNNGNYWFNSLNTGFSQTCSNTNFDNLCDLSYSVYNGSFDYLPLTLITSVRNGGGGGGGSSNNPTTPEEPVVNVTDNNRTQIFNDLSGTGSGSWNFTNQTEEIIIDSNSGNGLFLNESDSLNESIDSSTNGSALGGNIVANQSKLGLWILLFIILAGLFWFILAKKKKAE